MSATKRLSQLPTEATLGSHHIIATDTQGAARKIDPLALVTRTEVKGHITTLADTSGMKLCSTGEATEGLPEGAPTKYGILLEFTYSVGKHALFVWFTFHSTSAIYAQQMFSGELRGWVKLS